MKDLNIFALYVQHGLYVHYMKRNAYFFINNLTRVLSSLFYIIDISSLNLFAAANIASVYLNGKNRAVIPRELRDGMSLNVVLSEYWKKFHQETYKINSNYFIAGFLDSLKFRTKSVDGIVYCAQTLVEDGRISKLVMSNFYQELFNFGIQTTNNIYIKTHPRNSLWTVNCFKDMGFRLVNDDVPVGNVTIGHYSSLLPIWSTNMCPIIIVELPKHATPESILNLASLTVNTLKEIDSQTLNNLQSNKKHSIILVLYLM